MIIFDLDGTLADCEHRRHFVDPRKHPDFYIDGKFAMNPNGKPCDKYGNPFKPDWKSFYDVYDKDFPIMPAISVYMDLRYSRGTHIEIWSGRCESVREKTDNWLNHHDIYYEKLKMRPIGDNTPDDQLKERWLDEYISSMWPKLPIPNEENKNKIYHRKDPIEMVFDSDPKSIEMWRRRGIFVFNCKQSGMEF